MHLEFGRADDFNVAETQSSGVFVDCKNFDCGPETFPLNELATTLHQFVRYGNPDDILLIIYDSDDIIRVVLD